MNSNIEQLSEEEKAKLIAAARAANAIPGEDAFWDEVEQQLDKYGADAAEKVQPRTIRRTD